jgi:hypothetical protein
MESCAYSTGSIKSITSIVVHMTLGDQVHLIESDTYSARKINSICFIAVHIALDQSSASHEYWCIWH